MMNKFLLSPMFYCFRGGQQVFLFLLLSLFLFNGITTTNKSCLVDAKQSSHVVSPSEFGQWWKDSQIIMESLNEYQALWIKVHNCVWSECAVDNNDDDGENRDGDENWYLARTQEFCANIAFSLYGIRKNTFAVPFMECSRGTYIDSFFTYGGADTLLNAVGKKPTQYFEDDDDGYYNNNNNGQNGNDDGYYNGQKASTTSPNANCHVVADDDSYLYDYFGDSSSGNSNNVDNNYNDEYDNNDDGGNDDGAGDGDGGRALSGDNNYNDDYMSGMSSTLGCSKNGKFALALFQGKTCDGNFFLDTTEDRIRKYNRESRINCMRVWGRAFGSNSTIVELLSNSWSCDLDVYPKACPDPHGFKQRHANALHAVAHGNSPKLAIWNGRLKIPLRVLSLVLFLLGVLLAAAAYYLKNRGRIHQTHSKLGLVRGFMKCLIEDYQEFREAQRRRQLEELEEQERRRAVYIERNGGGNSGEKERKLSRRRSEKRSSKKKKKRRSGSGRGDSTAASPERDEEDGGGGQYHRHDGYDDADYGDIELDDRVRAQRRSSSHRSSSNKKDRDKKSRRSPKKSSQTLSPTSSSSGLLPGGESSARRRTIEEPPPHSPTSATSPSSSRKSRGKQQRGYGPPPPPLSAADVAAGSSRSPTSAVSPTSPSSSKRVKKHGSSSRRRRSSGDDHDAAAGGSGGGYHSSSVISPSSAVSGVGSGIASAPPRTSPSRMSPSTRQHLRSSGGHNYGAGNIDDDGVDLPPHHRSSKKSSSRGRRKS